jgi:cytochrome c-type biogenesis protein CcmE
MKVIVDRFEGDLAVCEKDDRTTINIKRGRLPATVREGDVVIIEGDLIRIDSTETARRKAAADQLMKDLWKDNKA